MGWFQINPTSHVLCHTGPIHIFLWARYLLLVVRMKKKKKGKKLSELDTNHRDTDHPPFIQNTFMLFLLILSILTLIILLWMLLSLFYKWSHASESMLYVFLSKIWFYLAWNSALSAKSLNDKWLAFGSGKCLYSF